MAIIWKGGWTSDGSGLSDTTYYEDEVVSHLNVSYIAKAEVAIGSPVPSSDMSNWDTFVSGAIGTSGTSGTSGTTGTSGTSGFGVPTGGTSGQILQKVDGTNYNTEWTTLYSEGTWTPTLSQNGFSISMIASARWIKVGKMVTVIGDITIAGTFTGVDANLIIGGLPFTVANNGWVSGTGYFQNLTFDFRGALQPSVLSNENTLGFAFMPINTELERIGMLASGIKAGYCNFQITYFVD
jgi:hypothetical protein